MVYKVMQAASILAWWLVGVVGPCSGLPAPDLDNGPLLSSFTQDHHDVSHNPDGTYVFSFSLPQQERKEHRDADGKVIGSFAFVDRTGQEVSVQFDADQDGYRPQSDALPLAPHYTDEVALARDQFLRYYQQRAKFLQEVNSDEYSDEYSDESYEDDDVESDEDSSSEEDEDDDVESNEDSSSEEDED